MQALKWGLLSIPAVAGFALMQKVAQPEPLADNTVTQDVISLAPPEQIVTSSVEPSDSLVLKTVDLPEIPDLQEPKLDVTRTGDVEDTKKLDQVSEEPSIFSKLHDYTFKLINPCGIATGWILDYQLPKNPKDYPLTWYIATAAHVVKQWKFDENTYEQKLPNSCHSIPSLPSYLTLAKRNESDKSDSRKVIGNPKLFWTALDLFKKDSKFDILGNNFKDFAVIEITFDNEANAKRMTNNFAEKYKSGPSSGINIFGEALELEKTKENNPYFYSLSYPASKTREVLPKSNWIETDSSLGVLSGALISKYKTSEEDKLEGFLPISKLASKVGQRQISWASKKYNKFGHYYYTKGVKWGPGSSGSMIVDVDGNLLGVRSMGGAYSLFTPIRSKKVISGEIKTPEYDLISGVKGQKSSYRQQVEEHLLKNGKTTWLSSSQNWTYSARA